LTFVTPAAALPTSPTLSVSLTNGDTRVLILSGTPGSNYVIMLTTSLSSPITWTMLTNIILTSPVQTINTGLPANQLAFFALETAAPSVTTLAASTVTATNAILNATVNPDGGPTAVYFEYGPTTAYGNFSATNVLASSLTNAQSVAQLITGLPPGTTNHFQAVAQNGLGTNFGGDLAFVTPAAALPTSPTLNVSLTNGARVLILSGTPGSNYVILLTTNLSSPITWTVLTNLTLTNSVQYINTSIPANQTAFFVLETAGPPPVLGVSLTNSANVVLTLQGNSGSGYTILSATNLVPPIPWTVLTNLTLTNAVQLINTGLPANRMEFFRAFQGQ
jgi:predicted secreted protein